MTSQKSKWSLVLATFFGLGYSPVAPGTVGALGGVALYFLFHFLQWGGWAYAIFVIALCFVGIWVSSLAEESLKDKDPSEVVIDEVIGFLVAMFAIPFSWSMFITGFLVNRALDIWKPWPARKMEGLRGGLGIVLDDVVTGVYTNILLRVILLVAAQ